MTAFEQHPQAPAFGKHGADAAPLPASRARPRGERMD
jgi:hypothetical protein